MSSNAINDIHKLEYEYSRSLGKVEGLLKNELLRIERVLKITFKEQGSGYKFIRKS